MRTINISALVLRGDSMLDPERPDDQVIALLLESGALKDEQPVVIAKPDAIGFEVLAILLRGTDESKPIRVSLEADAADKSLADCVTSDIVVKAIYAI